MFREYAVEPQTYVGWAARSPLFCDSFGYEAGRLISRFPANWVALALQHFERMPDGLRRKSAEIWLPLAKKKIIPAGDDRTYDRNTPWLTNAVREHLKREFAAVISESASQDRPFCLSQRDLSDENELWRVSRCNRLDSKPHALATALGPLLARSKEVLFVDPYFLKGESQKRRWLDPLRAFLRVAFDSDVQKRRVEYHTTDKRSGTSDWFSDHCRTQEVHRYLPRGREIRLVRWRERNDGEDLFHARYILTELGGVRMDPGLDIHSGKKTHVELLDEGTRQQCWEDLRNGGVYEFVDELVVTSSGEYRLSLPDPG